MADDDILEVIAGLVEGANQGFTNTYIPLKKMKYENDLMMQRQAVNNNSDLDLYKKKLELQEPSEMRINAAKREPVQMTEVQDAEGNLMRTTRNKVETLPKPAVTPIDPYQREEMKRETEKLKRKPKAEIALRTYVENVKNTIRQIDDVLANKKFGRGTGFLGRQEARIEGTPAFDVREKIKSIQAATALDNLTELRAASPTGGALGNVSNQDTDLLKSSKANINPDQSEPEARKSLEDLKAFYMGSVRRMQEGYEMDFGETPNFGTNKLQSPSIGGNSTGVDKKSELRRKLGLK